MRGRERDKERKKEEERRMGGERGEEGKRDKEESRQRRGMLERREKDNVHVCVLNVKGDRGRIVIYIHTPTKKVEVYHEKNPPHYLTLHYTTLHYLTLHTSRQAG